MADQTIRAYCGFFDSVNRDRLYSADEMNRPYKRLVSNGVFATQSGTPSTDLQVLASTGAMDIVVKAGQGIFADKWFELSTDTIITVPNNTNVVPRRDSVIVQIDKRVNGRVGNIVYRTGTPSTNPQPPEIGTVTNVIEYRVANIYVAAGATNINQDAIVDLRGSSECPWVTSLVHQVDTSTLYNQWQSAYQSYYTNTTEEFEEYAEARRTAFDEFIQTLTEELTVTTNVILLENEYTTVGNETTLPIGIPSFDKDTDILQVFVNGLKASGYSVSDDSTNIILTTPLIGNQKVYFVVFKSVVTGDIESCLSAIQTLNARITSLHIDGGWINFSLESGATAYDSDSTPAIRKYGNQVFIRGAIKGLDRLNVPICTLPPAYVPAKPHYVSVVVGSIVCTLKVSSTITIVAKSGTIQTSAMLPITTSFILG